MNNIIKMGLIGLLGNLLLIVPAQGQKRIENMVNKFSTYTDTQFTSTLERDPSTRRITKRIKRLQYNYPSEGSKRSFKQVFDEEAKQATLDTKKNNGNHYSHVLVFRSKKETKVYRLDCKPNQNIVLLVTEIKK